MDPNSQNPEIQEEKIINPNIENPMPMPVKLEAGVRISWCTCGYSGKEPFCDGAHRACETNLRSFKFEPTETKTYVLCGCKQTKNPPFCDGTHGRLL